jgi:hypothetical protein
MRKPLEIFLSPGPGQAFLGAKRTGNCSVVRVVAEPLSFSFRIKVATAHFGCSGEDVERFTVKMVPSSGLLYNK